MFCCMSLMGLPWLTNKIVDAMGGRGAWAEKAEALGLRTPPPSAVPDSKTQAKKAAKAAAAAANNPEKPTFAHALRVPLSVWLPPMMFLAASFDPENNPFEFSATVVIVYMTIVGGQYVRNRIWGLPKY